MIAGPALLSQPTQAASAVAAQLAGVGVCSPRWQEPARRPAGGPGCCVNMLTARTARALPTTGKSRAELGSAWPAGVAHRGRLYRAEVGRGVKPGQATWASWN